VLEVGLRVLSPVHTTLIDSDDDADTLRAWQAAVEAKLTKLLATLSIVVFLACCVSVIALVATGYLMLIAADCVIASELVATTILMLDAAV
jgi:hypothetical protein